MKNKNQLLKIATKSSAMILLLCNLATAEIDQGGSAGTRGGSNLPSWTTLFPNSVSLYRLYEFRPSGRRAEGYRYDCPSAPHHRLPPVYLYKEVVATLDATTQRTEAQTSLLRHGERVAVSSRYRDDENPCQSIVRDELYVDNHLTEYSDLIRQIEAAGQYMVSQIEITSPATWVEAIRFDQRAYYVVLSLYADYGFRLPERRSSTLSHFIDFAQTPVRFGQTALEERLTLPVQQLREELSLLMEASWTAEGHCHLPRYNELKARLRTENVTPTSVLSSRFIERSLNEAVNGVTDEERQELEAAIAPITRQIEQLRQFVIESMGGALFQACEINAPAPTPVQFERRRRRSNR